MPIQKCKPTSPGRRFVEKVVHDHLHKGAPYSPLVEAKKRTGGRNNNGHITTRHVGGGHKQHYRLVDFKRNKDGIPATVERIEYDPNRTAHIALVLYADGERRYIIAPKGLRAGDKVQSGNDAPIRPGNCLPLRNMLIRAFRATRFSHARKPLFCGSLPQSGIALATDSMTSCVRSSASLSCRPARRPIRYTIGR